MNGSQSDHSVAFDYATGELFVTDGLNNRVAVFDSGGGFLRAFGWNVAPDGAPGDTASDQLETCTTTCQGGVAGASGGQFERPSSIAVDNDPLSPAYHDLYVSEGTTGEGNARVQRFTPGGVFVLAFGDGVNQTTGGDVCTAVSGDICKAGTPGAGAGQFVPDTGNGFNVPRLAVGSGGTVHVADYIPGGSRLQRFDPAGTFLSQLAPLPSTASATATMGLAVRPSGDFYITTNGLGVQAARKYDPAGNLLAILDSGNGPIAIGPAGNPLVADVSEAKFGMPAVARYDSDDNLIGVHYGNGTLAGGDFGVYALAPYSNANGDFFAWESSAPNIAHIAFELPGPVVLPRAVKTFASLIGNLSATLNARVNPEAKPTTVHFEYVDDANYQTDGFASASTIITPESTSIGADFASHLASFAIPCAGPGQPGCLQAETTYHFRAVASNTDGEDTGPESIFKTLPPITLGDTWSTDVRTDSAILHAALNPHGVPATAHFEYVDEATYQATGFADAQSTSEFDFGADNAELSKVAELVSLTPGTTYRYRYIANDFFGDFIGPEASFTTYALPDPPNTECSNQAFRIGPSAALSDCRAYEMVSPVDKNGGEISSLNVTVLSALGNIKASLEQADPQGERVTYSATASFGDAEGARWASQYLSHRDPQQGWSTDNITPPGPSLNYYVPEGIRVKAFSEDLCSAWMVEDRDIQLAPGAIPGVPNLYRHANALPGCTGPEGYETLSMVEPPTYKLKPGQYFLKPQGFSADGTHTVFRAFDDLTPNASKKDISQLYLSYGGALELVSVLPGGKTAAGTNSSVGTLAGVDATDPIFDSLHHAVSEDGGRVFWSANIVDTDFTFIPKPARLYLRLNADQPQSAVSAGACTEPLKACTIKVSETVSADPATFWAANPQGTKALFTIDSGPQARNLYSFDVESGTSTLIAGGVTGLMGASEDLSRVYFRSTHALAPGALMGGANLYFGEAGSFDLIATLPSSDSGVAVSLPTRNRQSRVSPDGLHTAFISTGSLTGYDNADAVSGVANREVFVYDAAANGGAGELLCASCNPSGERPRGAKVLEGASPGDPGVWVAGSIPGWQNGLHPSRVLSDDGQRLFFDSFDALIPADTNDVADVYQWEAPGSGDCDSDDTNYFDPNGGCLSLISSGTSGKDSRFIDASASGSDVFFVTNSSLVSQDLDLLDVYDARIGGGFPEPPPAPAPCDLDAGACQGAASNSPEVPGAGSASFEGAGDPPPIFASPCVRFRKEAQRKLDSAKRADGAKKAEGLRRQARDLKDRAKRCKRRASR